MKTTEWPPPCRQCGGIDKQQTEWSTDAKNFRQTCHRSRCRHKGDWEPYPPTREQGWTYEQIKAIVPVRAQALVDARNKLTFARKLSLHSPPIRDEIGRIIAEVDDCLRSLS